MPRSAMSRRSRAFGDRGAELAAGFERKLTGLPLSPPAEVDGRERTRALSPCGLEWVFDADAVVVLHVTEVFGEDHGAPRRAGSLQNERVPMRDPVLRRGGRRHDQVRGHRHDWKGRELFQRVQRTCGIERSLEASDIHIELVEDLRGQDDVVGRDVFRKEVQGDSAFVGLIVVLGIDEDVGVEERANQGLTVAMHRVEGLRHRKK